MLPEGVQPLVKSPQSGKSLSRTNPDVRQHLKQNIAHPISKVKLKTTIEI